MKIFHKGIVSCMFLMFTLLASAQTLSGNSPYKPIGLRCEYLLSPIGIDSKHPRLTWYLQDDRQGAIQKSYQIHVSTDSSTLEKGKGDAWESGKVESSTNLVTYQGKPLAPFTRYYWCVEVWDKDGKKLAPSAINSFETGMMEMENWKGAWISDDKSINVKPAPYFRKGFTVAKKVKSARAYIAVAGLYELSINGMRVGDHRLDPVYTRFDRRTMYVAYDVTSMLNEGKNAIGVLLGNGWYNLQSTAVWEFHKAPWRNRPAFCMDLRITYEDGSIETIKTDKDWKTALSPVIFNSIYTGEHYDARLEIPGWDNADFNDSGWTNVIFRAAPSQNIVSQSLQPIRNIEEIPAKSMNRIDDTTFVFDLGRNIAGVSRLRVKGDAGTIIRLKHSERLYQNGKADQSNISVHYRPTDETDPFQTDIFILSGQGEETFMPRFNYKGFQYVEVTSSKPVELTRESLYGYFMHSDVPVVGNVASSNPTIDKIWSATNHSYLSNLFGYPTDCPQREKNGWTGDAHIASETGLYNFDGITIYEKWLQDHRDEQQPNGVLPAIIPSNGWGYEWANGPDWTSTIAIIPWNIYLFYGDSKLLNDCYDNIKRYVDHITSLSPNGLTTWGLGDWVPVKSKSPVELTSSIYYFVDATILAKSAKLFGKKDDFVTYTALAEKIRNAINTKYLNTETGIYGSGFQTELSAPLFWGVVPTKLKEKVAANLAKRIEADNWHLDVGLLGTKAVLNALSENGYADAAYKVASQETFPSWGWWIVNGATTLYENWPIDAKSDISMNHIMFGEIGAWLYKGLGGIKPDEEHPGFRNVLIEPHFVTGLDHFEASHAGPNGIISSYWKRTGDKISYTLVVPANSTATVKLHVQEGQKIYQNGRLAGNEIKSPSALDTSGHIFSCKVPAGTYRFELQK